MSHKLLRQNRVPKTMVRGFTSPGKPLLVSPELLLSFYLHFCFLLTLPWTSFLTVQKTFHLVHLKTFLALPLGKNFTPAVWSHLVVKEASIFYTVSLSPRSHLNLQWLLTERLSTGATGISFLTYGLLWHHWSCYSLENCVFLWLQWLSSLGSSSSPQQDCVSNQPFSIDTH